MKRNPTFLLKLFSLVLILMFFLSSCSGKNNIKEIKMKDNSIIEISQGDFSYEDKKLIIVYNNRNEEEIDLKENMIPEVERLKFFKIGEHDVKIIYRRLTTTMKIKVTRKNFDDSYSLVGYTCVYDGLAHKVELNNELPEGATIEYLYGNSFVNVGRYDIKAVISKDGYNPKTLSATLIIEKANYDESNIVFNNLTTTYDGKAKTIEALNVPNGVTVKYSTYYLDSNIEIKEAKEAGNYKVVASFESLDHNYNKIENKEALLTIKKAKYDMSNVRLDDYTKTYDGEDYVPSLRKGSTLPKNVNVEFKCYNENNELVESNAAAGNYKIVASFKGDDKNYEPIDDIEATLTVNKMLIEIKDSISFESKTINYDGNVHSLDLVGTLPAGVNYTINGNEKIYAGEYAVKVQFEALDSNYRLDINEIVSYLIINPINESVIVLDNGIEREILTSDVYFSNGELEIRGFNSDKYQISKTDFYDVQTDDVVSIDDLENGREYSYIINFSFVDTKLNSSITLAPISGLIIYTN